MNRAIRTAVLLFIAMAVLPSVLRADEVIFKNGDKVTGKLLYDGLKLTIDSPSTGKILVDLKNVKSIISSGPIDVVLADGTVLHQKATAGPEGQIVLVPEGGAPQRTIAMKDIKKINPPPVKWTVPV